MSKFSSIARYLPLFVCIVSSFVAASSGSKSKALCREVLAREAELNAIATNFFCYAVRIDLMEQDLRALSSRPGASASTSDQATLDTRKGIQNFPTIPYRYFSGRGSAGICNGPSVVWLGERSRYGVLTNCGLDFAEFDGRNVVGLGVSNDERSAN